MKKLIFGLLIVCSFLTAQTNQGFYFGLAPAYLTYESKGVKPKFHTVGEKYTLGYIVKSYGLYTASIEGSIVLAGSDKKASVTNSYGTFKNAEVTIEQLYTLHIKNQFNFSTKLNGSFYIGATRGKVYSSSDRGVSKKKFENSFSYGAGIEYKLNQQVSIQANYMQYYKNLSSVEVGFVLKF